MWETAFQNMIKGIKINGIGDKASKVSELKKQFQSAYWA